MRNLLFKNLGGLSLLSALQIKLVGPDDQPVSNEAVYLFAEDSLTLTLTTDLKGIVLFSLDTTFWKDSVSLRVSWSVFYLFFIFS